MTSAVVDALPPGCLEGSLSRVIGSVTQDRMYEVISCETERRWYSISMGGVGCALYRCGGLYGLLHGIQRSVDRVFVDIDNRNPGDLILQLGSFVSMESGSAN